MLSAYAYGAGNRIVDDFVTENTEFQFPIDDDSKSGNCNVKLLLGLGDFFIIVLCTEYKKREIRALFYVDLNWSRVWELPVSSGCRVFATQ